MSHLPQNLPLQFYHTSYFEKILMNQYKSLIYQYLLNIYSYQQIKYNNLLKHHQPYTPSISLTFLNTKALNLFPFY